MSKSRRRIRKQFKALKTETTFYPECEIIHRIQRTPGARPKEYTVQTKVDGQFKDVYTTCNEDAAVLLLARLLGCDFL